MKTISTTTTELSFFEVVEVLSQALQLEGDQRIEFKDKKGATQHISNLVITSKSVVSETEIVTEDEEDDAEAEGRVLSLTK